MRVIYSSFLEYDSTAKLRKDPTNQNIFYYGSNDYGKHVNYKSQKKNIGKYLKSLFQLANEAGNTSIFIIPIYLCNF